MRFKWKKDRPVVRHGRSFFLWLVFMCTLVLPAKYAYKAGTHELPKPKEFYFLIVTVNTSETLPIISTALTV